MAEGVLDVLKPYIEQDPCHGVDYRKGILAIRNFSKVNDSAF